MTVRELVNRFKQINSRILTKVQRLTKIRLVLTCLIFVFTITGLLSLLIGENVFVRGYKSILRLAGVYTEPIESVTINGDGYTTQTPGSWSINKSAKWIGKGKAEVVFDVSSVMKADDIYRDIIIVMDNSDSMILRFPYTKTALNNLISKVLNDENNRIAFITFNTTSEIVSNFTNDKTQLLSQIESLTYEYTTNYNAALKKVLELIEGYQKQNNRELTLLFMTDGYPFIDTPNEVSTYETIKELYPYIKVEGVQIQSSGVALPNEALKKISDNQFAAEYITLNKVLLEASFSPYVYEEFIITDYIENEYFEVKSLDDIKVPYGEVEIIEEGNGQKIIWNLSNLYRSGNQVQMKINLSLKQQYIGVSDYYPTNKKEDILSKLPEETSKTQTSNLTPVLQSHYNVYYNSNTPTGCQNQDLAEETHQVGGVVLKKDTKLVCSGYQFKGWEISTENVEKVNEDYFIMPGKDVTIKGIWTKHNISKSMDGEVRGKTTLYDVLKNETISGRYARKYTGEHQDSMAGIGDKEIYHWYGANDADGTMIRNKNNVIFGEHCWQMIRTTDTGGVKLLYNGEPVNNTCLDTRGEHVGYYWSGPNYNYKMTASLNSNYYYGTSYEYNKTNKMFSLSGTKTRSTWSDTTYNSLIGKYTCMSTTSTGTCQTLYLVESYNDSTSANVLPLESNSHYSEFGIVQFNYDYGPPARVGYMYGDIYQVRSINSNSSFVFGNSVSYSNGVYRLQNTKTAAMTDDLTNHHYTCFTTGTTCEKVRYMYYLNQDRLVYYYIELENGKKIEDALYEMLKADNVNRTNSVIKTAVEAWYEKYLLNYDSYIEDSIYCHDRSISNLGGFNPNGGELYDISGIKGVALLFSRSNNLSCKNETDKFSVSNSKAPLKYKVGLITYKELELLNNDQAKYSAGWWWSLSPSDHGGDIGYGACVYVVRPNGIKGHQYVYFARGLRPSISLKPNIEYTSGNGSMEYPYIIETN